MHVTISIYLKYITITLMLFTLSACGTLQTIYEETPSLFQKAEKTELNPLLKELRALDLANDREAARNRFMQELITSSDKICEKYKQQILNDSQQWNMYSEKGGLQFETKLKEAISLRQSDRINPNMTILSMHEMDSAEHAMATILTETIESSQKMARIQLKARMEDSIRQYSVKQGLLDLQAYHHSCSVQFAAAAVARARAEKMTPEEKSASIEALLQLRQKLMDEGLNTRAVQQKIDALILAH